MPDETWILDAPALDAFAQRLVHARNIAFDLEADAGLRYHDQVCLIQCNLDGDIFLIDPLATKGLPGLADGLGRSDRPLLLHGGEYDVICCKRDFGISLRGVRDTQQAATLLGLERTGYGALVQQFLGITLEKAFARYDWATRPLDPLAVQYAADDVRHLPLLAEKILEQIQAKELDDEFAIANRVVEESTGRHGPFQDIDLWHVRGVGKLRDQSLPVLLAICRWRETIAEKENLSPGRILNGDQIIALAKQPPRCFGQLRAQRLPGRFLSDHGEDLIALVKEAIEHPPELPPAPPKRRIIEDAEVDRIDRLKTWRQKEAETRGIGLQGVLPAKALECLAQHPAINWEEVPQMGPARVERYGQTLRNLLKP
jgi:ribonuclease D